MSENGYLKIGVVVDCLQLPVREGIAKTAEMGAKGIQVWVTSGEMLAENMSSAQRKEFVKYYEDHGLTLTALCIEFGPSLRRREDAAELMPKLKAAVDQAVDLKTGVISAHLGGMSADPSDPEYDYLQRAAKEFGDYASERGVVYAVETGGEPGDVLRRALDNFDTDGIRVNFDPANLTMRGFDHMQAVRDLKPYVVHSHAKDGRKGVGELPLGEGDVNYPQYIALWRSLGYDGFFTIEREVGDNREGDIRHAIEFLKSLQ